eukprot:CCRYP_015913-RA/>CCRYP_015913-RA protein AED:0.01 eAED:0.01 QI:137/1/1/1/0.66/0.5/4/982/1465
MPTNRACAGCHKAKCKCFFPQETGSKCDRCIRLNRECVPHLSRQGRRNKKGKEKEVSDAAAFHFTPSVAPFVYSGHDVTTMGSEGCDAGVSQHQLIHMVSGCNVPGLGNLFSQSQAPGLQETSQSQGVPSSSMPHQNDNPLFCINLDQIGVPSLSEARIPSPPGAANFVSERATLTTQRQQTKINTHHSIENIAKTGDTVNNHRSSSTASIPLRQWINRAHNADGNSPISPQYLVSCLKIAVSLSKTNDDTEQFSCTNLLSLPIDVANWAGLVVVNMKESDRHTFPTDDEPSDDLALLEAWFEKICEEEQIGTSSSIGNSCFYNVDSADFLTDATKLDENGVALPSSEDKRKRIYALGLVFYELFSGGILPPPELLPVSSSEGPGVTLTFYETVNLSDLNCSKLNNNEEISSNDTLTRKKLSKPHVQLQSVIESLKAIGLPYRLCDLLYNMLDCINGDLSGCEAFVNMTDVTAELQLMLDNPLKFMHDPDVSAISSAGLQLKDMSVVRNEEFASLQQAYHRATDGSSEFAIITGGSGTGKSYLAFRLGRHITDCGGIFLPVKFDPVAQARPFSALVVAFNQYCNMLTTLKDSNWVKSIATKLRDALGQDVNHLVKVIPKLSEILDHDATGAALNQECVNGLNKIHYLLIRFVEVISTCSKVTVTLLLDDLQWSDAFSLSVLEQIIKMPAAENRFFFIGCYRGDEMEDSHSFKKIMDCSIAYGIRLTMVHLDVMEKDTVNTMVSELLCLSPRLVNSLSDIVYSKTKGNVLFLSRLLISLNRDGLLNFSLRRRRWVWDEEQIQSRKLPDDVASFFSNSIRGLSRQVQTALQVLSCFGSAEECELSLLESNLRLELVKPLELAVDEGFVSKNDQQYRFSHDKILQSAYEMAQLEDRRLQHLQYGICLAKGLETEKATDMLLTAVGQINLAGPSVVTDPTLSTEFAAHNLTAGKKAIDMSEYTAAAIYAKNGISFLKKENHWRLHYKLSLELFELATKCMLVLGDFSNLTILSDQVCENARSLEDKLHTLFTVMTSLTYASKMPDSINMGLSILLELGYALPTTFTVEDTMALMKQYHKELSIPDHNLLTYKKMSDRRQLMAMKCLAKMELTTSMANPFLQPIVTLKMVELTIEHGLSSMSPVGFAYFAGLLLKHGEMQAGFRFAQLAMQMVDQVGSKEVAGDIYEIFSSFYTLINPGMKLLRFELCSSRLAFAGEVIFNSTQVLCFHFPLPSVNEYRLRGQDAALAAGDVPFACGLKLANCVTLFWAGSNLISTKDVYTHAGRYMKGQNNLTSYNLLRLSYNAILALLGEADENQNLTEDLLTNPLQRLTFYFQNMYVYFLLNAYDDMKQFAEKFFEFRQVFECKMSIWYAMHEFYGGLVSYRIYRETGDTKWLDRGRQCKSAIKLWAEQGSLWNFEQKHYLLEAEEQHCHFNLLAAKSRTAVLYHWQDLTNSSTMRHWLTSLQGTFT